MAGKITWTEAKAEYEWEIARLIRMELEEREILKDLVAPCPDKNSSQDSWTA